MRQRFIQASRSLINFLTSGYSKIIKKTTFLQICNLSYLLYKRVFILLSDIESISIYIALNISLRSRQQSIISIFSIWKAGFMILEFFLPFQLRDHPDTKPNTIKLEVNILKANNLFIIRIKIYYWFWFLYIMDNQRLIPFSSVFVRKRTP